MVADQEWESILQIKTAGRDDSRSDAEHHPYEPTDYYLQKIRIFSDIIID